LANALLPLDTAFFGLDKKGRATNIVDYVFPMSRMVEGAVDDE